MKSLTQFILLITIVISSCTPDDVVTDGLAPIYGSFDDFSTLKTEAAKPYDNLGKIVTSGNYIYINEINKGIHVINNTNPANPVIEYFWNIIGNREFTINDGVLYADNGKHLLVIDISNPGSIALIKVIRDQYEVELKEEYPLDYTGWFDCYKPEQGLLLGWETKELTNPICRID